MMVFYVAWLIFGISLWVETMLEKPRADLFDLFVALPCSAFFGGFVIIARLLQRYL